MMQIVDLTPAYLSIMGETSLMDMINDFSFAALHDNGEPFAAGGVVEIWPGRGNAWFTCTRAIKRRDWAGLTRAIRRGIKLIFEMEKYHRIEITVYDQNDKARRWALRLGFYPEAKCRKLMPDGSDGWIYSICQETGLSL